MNPRLLKLTHADIKDPATGKHEELLVDMEQIAYALYLPSKQATCVTVSGGAIALVKETKEFIMNSKMEYFEGNKPKLPTLEGLKQAQEILKGLYEKQPSPELIEAIKSGTKEKKRARPK